MPFGKCRLSVGRCRDERYYFQELQRAYDLYPVNRVGRTDAEVFLWVGHDCPDGEIYSRAP